MGQTWNKITRYRSKEARILLLGLESVGKTTLLYRLKLGETIKTTPTIGFNVETFQYRDLFLNAWDLGFGGKMRPLCQHYYKGSNAVVIMIDSCDRERLEEVAYDVIKPALKSDDLKDAIFLFLANKSDLENGMTIQEISDLLALHNLKRKWNIFSISALNGNGISDAFDWLASQLDATKVKSSNQTISNTCDTNSAVVGPQIQTDTCASYRTYNALACFYIRPQQALGTEDDNSDDETDDVNAARTSL